MSLSLCAAAASPKSGRDHWAYQPIREPALPRVRHAAQVASPIDSFVIQKLEARGLTLSSPVDRRTLLRRAYYDLIGLPPTYGQVEAFVVDKSSDAFARVVDRLLASPMYGERWGRHWLDVARYAETKDLVLLYGPDRLHPFAYTYRDYVIRAFNSDTPFAAFVHEQIAADLVEPRVEPWRLAAMGFLTLGRLYDNNLYDQIDDQIDTVSRGLLGLTVSCARCHDHKYDAIPANDYYGLYGVFANSERPCDLPLIEDPSRVEGGPAFEKKLADALRNLDQHMDEAYEKQSDTASRRVGDYLVRAATTKPDISETATFALSLTPDDLRPSLVMRWRRYLEERANPTDPVFGVWSDLMALPEESFAAQVAETLSKSLADTAKRRNPLIVETLKSAALTNKADVARAYGELFKRIYAQSRQPGTTPGRIGEAERELLSIVAGKESPAYFPRSQTPLHMSRPEKDKYGGLVRELDKLAAYATNAPPAHAMVLRDSQEIREPRLFVRGSPARPGAPVPRAFLTVLSGPERKSFTQGSGRLELAHAITAPDNPLTPRVIVNRIWMHHFGEPLVGTPNDFGTRSTPPTHPELLDYLSWHFIKDGGSFKNLHRRIMLSSTYQQAGKEREDGRKADPDNRLLWRANRHRLELEAMRDTLLCVSGRLDPAMGGRSMDVSRDHLNRRRTVYGLVDRQDVPGMFRAFDFACPDQSAERRPRTSVPQQALFAMNSPFVMEQAVALARRPEIAGESDPARRVAGLYHLALARAPTQAEVSRALRFLRDAGPVEKDQLTGWEQLSQVILMMNELMFVD
jgi:hypothetical protein